MPVEIIALVRSDVRVLAISRIEIKKTERGPCSSRVCQQAYRSQTVGFSRAEEKFRGPILGLSSQ